MSLISVAVHILANVPQDCSTIGNLALLGVLRNQLTDLDEGDYLAAKEALVADGLIVKGKGRGGSVALANGKAPSAAAAATSKPAPMSSGNGAAAYAHADEAVLRPDVGVEAQFSHRKPPKIPQLPARDVSGAEEAAYFNIWHWVQTKLNEQIASDDGGGFRS